MPAIAYGALRHLLRIGPQPRLDPEAHVVNAHLLLSRLWLGTSDRGVVSDDPALQLQHLRAVARAANSVEDAVLDSLRRRRRLLASALVARTPDAVVAHLEITPYWRVVVGHGETSVHETSLSMSPVHGVPIWPGSGLKGAASAHASARGDHLEDIKTRFGAPRPHTGLSDSAELAPRTGTGEVVARQGGAVILDAFPVTSPRVVVDVLTPHGGGYYREANAAQPAPGVPPPVVTPPAEYHNPVPVHFLAVETTPFHTMILGPSTVVEPVCDLLAEAARDEGLGGKTAAGYGYCDVTYTVEKPA